MSEPVAFWREQAIANHDKVGELLRALAEAHARIEQQHQDEIDHIASINGLLTQNQDIRGKLTATSAKLKEAEKALAIAEEKLATQERELADNGETIAKLYQRIDAAGRPADKAPGGESPPEPIQKLCAGCGAQFATEDYRRRYCDPCRLQRAKQEGDHAKDWPSRKITGYPCASCKHGKPNGLAESKYECKAEKAGTCCPQGPAWKYEAKP